MLAIDLPVQCGCLTAAAIPLERQRPPADHDDHKWLPQALTCGSTICFLNMLLVNNYRSWNLFLSRGDLLWGSISPNTLKGLEVLWLQYKQELSKIANHNPAKCQCCTLACQISILLCTGIQSCLILESNWCSDISGCQEYTVHSGME